MDGKKELGITIMYMDKGIDTGDMLTREKLAFENENKGEIENTLSELGAKMILETLEKIENGEPLPREKQDDSLSTYAAKIEKVDCLIDFTKSAEAVHNQIRGLSPIPLSFTHTADGKLLKVTEARIAAREGAKGEAGRVLSLENGIEVACGSGSILLLGVLPEGKGRMSAADFIRGRKVATGDILK